MLLLPHKEVPRELLVEMGVLPRSQDDPCCLDRHLPMALLIICEGAREERRDHAEQRVAMAVGHPTSNSLA